MALISELKADLGRDQTFDKKFVEISRITKTGTTAATVVPI